MTAIDKLPEFSPDPSPLLPRLRQLLNKCSQAVDSGDFHQSQSSFDDLHDFLGSVSDAALSDSSNEEASSNARDVLSEIHGYICSPSLGEATLDALSFELPKAAAGFSGVDFRCAEIADSVIQQFIERCSPRDMLSVLCEALDSSTKRVKAQSYFDPILRALSKVFLSLQRHHYEQVKVAVPIILNSLKTLTSESDDEGRDTANIFDRAIDIANSIKAVCLKLEGSSNEKLRALLGLYILQIMALISISTKDEVLSFPPLVLQLSCFFHYCGLSYLGLIDGNNTGTLNSIVLGEDDSEYMSCFSYIKHGAALAVIWGYMSAEVAHAAKEDINLVKDELRSSKTSRWQAIGMLKYILFLNSLPWKLKRHSINFLLDIMDGKTSQNDIHIDYSSHMPSLFGSLQAVQMFIMYAPEAALKKDALEALKRVLSDIPAYPRFEILKSLITNSESSSMIAILLDCVKEGLHAEIQGKNSLEKEVLRGENKVSKATEFWSTDILELVELVLRPPKGGPPCLPEQSEAVLSSLNLYRFVLITESAGKTNFTGVLTKNNLQKAYSEWFLPLRTLVTGIMAENQDYEKDAVDTLCTMNPVELVLYRCLELSEEKLKRCT